MANILSNIKADNEIVVFKTPNLKEDDIIHTIKVGEEYKLVSEPYFNMDVKKSIVNILFKPSEHIIGDGLLGFIEEIKKEPAACKMPTDTEVHEK